MGLEIHSVKRSAAKIILLCTLANSGIPGNVVGYPVVGIALTSDVLTRVHKWNFGQTQRAFRTCEDHDIINHTILSVIYS